MTYDGPLSVLCDTHAIPILLYVGEHGRCIKTDIYREVGRPANMSLRWSPRGMGGPPRSS